MSGYRTGSSRPLSAQDFNARAKALSERLGEIAKPARATPPRRFNKLERTSRGTEAPADDAGSAAEASASHDDEAVATGERAADDEDGSPTPA